MTGNVPSYDILPVVYIRDIVCEAGGYDAPQAQSSHFGFAALLNNSKWDLVRNKHLIGCSIRLASIKIPQEVFENYLHNN